jgi:hypothetical protein
MLFTPWATTLYFSSSSSREASSATGRIAAGIFLFVLTRVAAQLQEIVATVATIIQASIRRINRFRPQAYKLSNLATTRMPSTSGVTVTGERFNERARCRP